MAEIEAGWRIQEASRDHTGLAHFFEKPELRKQDLESVISILSYSVSWWLGQPFARPTVR